MDKAQKPSNSEFGGYLIKHDGLCGLEVRVPGYRSRDPRSISGATRFSEK
jgi:hypothetical protein